jgi:hypothetical protein
MGEIRRHIIGRLIQIDRGLSHLLKYASFLQTKDSTFQPVQAEMGSLLDPIQERHRFVDEDVI